MDYVAELRYMLLNFLYAIWNRRQLILIILICSPIFGVLLQSLYPYKYEATASIGAYKLNQDFMRDMPTTPNLEDQFDGIKANVTSPVVLKQIAIESGIISKNTSENKAQEVTEALNKAIQINLMGKNVAEIKLRGNEPKQLIHIVNSLSALFMKEFIKPILASTQSLSAILRKKYEEQKSKLDDSIKQLNLFSTAHPDLTLIYRDQLRGLFESIRLTQEKYKTSLAEIIWLESYLSTSSPEIILLDKQINEILFNLEKMKLLYNDNYQGIKLNQELLVSLQNQKKELIKNLKNFNSVITPIKYTFLSPSLVNALLPDQRKQYLTLQKKVNIAKEQLNDLYQQRDMILSKLKSLDKSRGERDLLIKMVQKNQTSYSELVNKYNMVATLSEVDFAKRFKVVELMSSPTEPLPYVGRPLIVYILAALVAGLVLGLSMAVILDLLDDTVKYQKSLQNITGVDVITRIGTVR